MINPYPVFSDAVDKTKPLGVGSTQGFFIIQMHRAD